MEENKKTDSSKQTEHKATTKITQPVVKKPAAESKPAVASKPAAASKPAVARKPTARKPIVRKPLLKTDTVPAPITADLEVVKSEKRSEVNANDAITLANEDTVKLDKKNLKKLKKMSDKVKEKEKKAKDK